MNNPKQEIDQICDEAVKLMTHTRQSKKIKLLVPWTLKMTKPNQVNATFALISDRTTTI